MTVTAAAIVFSTFPGASDGRRRSFAAVERMNTNLAGLIFALVGQAVSTLPRHARYVCEQPQLIQETALRNSTLQGAYMILAARALGLDCEPMSGFDNAKLDEEFFAAGKYESSEEEFFPEGHVKSNFSATSVTATLRRSCRGALGSILARHAPCCDCRLLALEDSAA